MKFGVAVPTEIDAVVIWETGEVVIGHFLNKVDRIMLHIWRKLRGVRLRFL